ncbi:MAG: hypothetical protein IT438_00220 [Phycisphaerales bacterium]|nr:hypothetical protein [Phycisphaerales bacterium]
MPPLARPPCRLSALSARLFVCAAIVTLATTPTTHADIDPVSGIDFVRIGAVGNAPWPGNGQPVDRAIGRGGVNTPPNVGCWRTADVNNAGGVSIQDLFDLLGAYFSWHTCE